MPVTIEGASAGRCVMGQDGDDGGAAGVLRGCDGRSRMASRYDPDEIGNRPMRRRAPGETVEPFRRRIHSPQAAPVVLRDRSLGALIPCKLRLAGLAAGDTGPRRGRVGSAGGHCRHRGRLMATRARKAAVALVAAAKDAEPSLGIRLLADCKVVFGDAEQMATKALLRGLIEIEEFPWGDLRGKPLDERGLAKRLRQYGIKSTTIRVSINDTPKGYRRADFLADWHRYVEPQATPARSATSATAATVLKFQRDNVADGVADSRHIADERNISATENHSTINGVASVALVADLPGVSVRTCAKCGAEDQERLLKRDADPLTGEPAWLHKECVRFWQNDNAARVERRARGEAW